MSQTPFARDQINKALPFLQDLTKIGNSMSNNVACQLTGCKGFESLPVRHIHAKFLTIDDRQACVGSANFYEPVLNPDGQNLNVGIITTDARYTQPLLTIFDNLQTSAGSRFVD